MLWMTQAEAIAQHFQVCGSPVPQEIEFPADLQKLSAQIPVPARFEQQGIVPAPTYQWYGMIGTRPLILGYEKDRPAGERVFIYTSYLHQQDQSGDWTVLLELSELPDSIFVMRPNFIMSRVREPKHVVFRPDPAGWNASLYAAASYEDADSLLKFLRQDKANDGCFIGPPEPQGQWATIQKDSEGERVLCNYPMRSTAISFACQVSSCTPSLVLVVKDLSRNSPDQYFVREGRVISRN